MTLGQILKLIFIYLPELIDIIKKAHAMAQAGYTNHQVKKALRGVDLVFDRPSDSDPATDAGDLDDIFRGSK